MRERRSKRDGGREGERLREQFVILAKGCSNIPGLTLGGKALMWNNHKYPLHRFEEDLKEANVSISCNTPFGMWIHSIVFSCVCVAYLILNAV